MIRAAQYELPREIKKRKICSERVETCVPSFRCIPQDLVIAILKEIVFSSLNLKQKRIERVIFKKLRPIRLVSKEWKKNANCLISYAINQGLDSKLLFNYDANNFLSFFQDHTNEVNRLKIGKSSFWNFLDREQMCTLFDNRRFITLGQQSLSNNFFCKIKKSFPLVEEVRISNFNFSKRGMKKLGVVFKKLRSLDIKTKISNEDFFTILKTQYRHVKTLTIRTPIDDAWIQAIPHKFDNISFFKACGNIQQDGLAGLLKNFQNLTHIDISGHKNFDCTELALEKACYPNLVYFNAEQTKTSAKGIEKIALVFPNLQTLKVPVEDQAIEVINEKFKNLQEFCCNPCDVRNKIFYSKISSMIHLKKLVVTSSSRWRLSEMCVSLIATHHVNLKSFELYNNYSISQKKMNELKEVWPNSATIVVERGLKK